MEEQEPHVQNEQKEESKRPKIALYRLILALALGYSLFGLSWVTSCSDHGREFAILSMCGSNLKAVVMDLQIYQAKHKDVLPPNLQALVLTANQSQSWKQFVCPGTDREYSPTTAPADFRKHCDYIFVLCNQTTADLPSDLPCLYELPLNHSQKEYVQLFFFNGQYACLYGMNDFRAEVQKVNDFLAEKRGGGQ